MEQNEAFQSELGIFDNWLSKLSMPLHRLMSNMMVCATYIRQKARSGFLKPVLPVHVFMGNFHLV